MAKFKDQILVKADKQKHCDLLQKKGVKKNDAVALTLLNTPGATAKDIEEKLRSWALGLPRAK